MSTTIGIKMNVWGKIKRRLEKIMKQKYKYAAVTVKEDIMEELMLYFAPLDITIFRPQIESQIVRLLHHLPCAPLKDPIYDADTDYDSDHYEHCRHIDSIFAKIKRKICGSIESNKLYLPSFLNSIITNAMTQYYPDYSLSVIERLVISRINAIHSNRCHHIYGMLDSDYLNDYCPQNDEEDDDESQDHNYYGTERIDAKVWVEMESKIEQILKNSDLTAVCNQDVKDELMQHFPHYRENPQLYRKYINIKISTFVDRYLLSDRDQYKYIEKVKYSGRAIMQQEPLWFYAWKTWNSKGKQCAFPIMFKSMSQMVMDIKRDNEPEVPNPVTPKPVKTLRKSQLVHKLLVTLQMPKNVIRLIQSILAQLEASIGVFLMLFRMPEEIIGLIQCMVFQITNEETVQLVNNECEILHNALFYEHDPNDYAMKVIIYEAKAVRIVGMEICSRCQKLVNFGQYRDITDYVWKYGIADDECLAMMFTKMKRFCCCHDYLRFKDAVAMSFLHRKTSPQIYAKLCDC